MLNHFGLRWVAIIGGSIVGALLIAVVALFLFPLGSDRLQHAKPRTLSFAEAVTAGDQAVSGDTSDPQVLPECRSQLLTHGSKTAKAVLMLHGYTSCPKDYGELAQLFYDRGYNVYVPRESHHGLQDVRASSKVKSSGLIDYADDAMNVAAGLGDEVGVIGISGGGVLGTWLAEYRPDTVTHLLALSPFYQPDSSQAPGIAIKPLIVLFGNRLLPDRNVGDRDHDFTLAGLAQYLRIVRNYRDTPINPKLRSVSVVFSAKDSFIDRKLAARLPAEIAKSNGLMVTTREFPPEFALPHNILDPAKLGTRTKEIEDLYFTLYES